jgi:prepilin-type N-terminal cleavage/methylation domain-containing protein
MHRSHARSAFTLIELLVVVAIIALLISILLPSLGKARLQAKNAACLANLKGWGLAYFSYCTEWDGNSIAYKSTTLSGHNPVRDAWGELLYPSPTSSYQRSNYNKSRICPLATDIGKAVGSGGVEFYGSATASWNYLDGEGTGVVTPAPPATDRIIGSYGFNLDLLSDRGGFPTNIDGSPSWFVTTDAVGKLTSGDYPDLAVLADSVWRDFEGRNNDNPLGAAWYTGNVAQSLQFGTVTNGTGGLVGPAATNGAIERCCIDRHQKAVNVAFRDGSARRERLSDLWSLRWNLTNQPRYRTGGTAPILGVPPEHLPSGYYC